MIIFGTRSVTTTPDGGRFNCPGCGVTRRYARKRVREYFHVYYIPLIPLNYVGDHIECTTCGSQYRTRVLRYDPKVEAAKEKAFAEEHNAILLRMMVAMMLSDGVMLKAEIETIRSIYGEIAGVDLPTAAVRRQVDECRRDGGSITEQLAAFAPSLKRAGREMFVEAAFRVAAADGRTVRPELLLLSEIAAALGISETQLRDLVVALRAEG